MSKMQRKPPNFYSRPCGRGDDLRPVFFRRAKYFYSRPCGRGDIGAAIIVAFREIFLLTPLREGRLGSILGQSLLHFISTHAPAGGATRDGSEAARQRQYFYSRPCGRGDLAHEPGGGDHPYFYSRPCGRGDSAHASDAANVVLFLLTPLREGRRLHMGQPGRHPPISTHAPAGGATFLYSDSIFARIISTHAPAGGATGQRRDAVVGKVDFYSRPCGRGDMKGSWRRSA